MNNVELDKIKFLIGLSHDEDFTDDIIDFELENGVYVLIVKKNIDNVKKYIRYSVSKCGSDVKIIKEKDDEVFCYYLKFRKIFDRYFGELTLDFTKQIMYEFNGDVLKEGVEDIKIISETSYDVAKKRGR